MGSTFEESVILLSSALLVAKIINDKQKYGDKNNDESNETNFQRRSNSGNTMSNKIKDDINELLKSMNDNEKKNFIIEKTYNFIKNNNNDIECIENIFDEATILEYNDLYNFDVNRGGIIDSIKSIFSENKQQLEQENIVLSEILINIDNYIPKNILIIPFYIPEGVLAYFAKNSTGIKSTITCNELFIKNSMYTLLGHIDCSVNYSEIIENQTSNVNVGFFKVENSKSIPKITVNNLSYSNTSHNSSDYYKLQIKITTNYVTAPIILIYKKITDCKVPYNINS